MAHICVAGLEKDRGALQAIRAEYDAQLPAVLERYSHWIDPLIARPIREALDAAEGGLV